MGDSEEQAVGLVQEGAMAATLGETEAEGMVAWRAAVVILSAAQQKHCPLARGKRAAAAL